MLKRWRILPLKIVGLLLLVAVILGLFRDQFLFHRRLYRAATIQNVEHWGGQRIEVVTSQGRQVAYYRSQRSDAAERPVFLWFICAGRASLALDFWGHTGRWDPRFAYVFVDYPGYGCCEGDPSSDHIAESIAAISSAVRMKLGWSEQELQEHAGVLGHSLGCAAALLLADHLNLKCAILCAPFTSVSDMAKRTVGWPLCWIAGSSFNNVERLASLTAAGAQVRVFHGMEDHTIPFQMSQTMAAKFPHNIRLTLLPDCGHGGVMEEAEQKIGWAMLGLARLSPATSNP